MGSLKDRLHHAFSIDAPGPAEPTPQQQPAIDWVCRQVAKRHLTTPGLIALEMSRPLNFMFAQGMHFFSPGAWALFRQQNYEHYRHFASFLEHRGAMDYLERRIEHFEGLYEQQERP